MKILVTMLLVWVGLAMPLRLRAQTLQYSLSLIEVTFWDYRDSDPNFFPIKKDDGTGLYVATGQPHWRSDQPNLKIPIAYQSGKKPRITAKLSLRCPKPIKGQVRIFCKMTNTNNQEEIIATFEVKKVTPAGSAGNYTLLYDKGIGSDLAKKIRYFSSCTLNWEVFFNDGSSQVVRESRETNEVYVTWKQPAGVEENMHTLFHLSCQANNDVTTIDPKVIFNNIWIKLFDVSNIMANGSNPKLIRKDNSPLTYYKTFSSSWATNAYNLIKTGEGICYAFSDLVLILCNIQGAYENSLNLRIRIDADRDKMRICANLTIPNIQLQSGDCLFLVNKWAFRTPKCHTDCAKFPYITASLSSAIDIVTNNRYNFIYQELDKIEGISGQNSQKPLAAFWNHSVITIDGKVYDPSYGTIYNSIADIQQCLSGWSYTRRNVSELFLGTDINRDSPTSTPNPNDRYFIMFTSNDNQASIFK